MDLKRVAFTSAKEEAIAIIEQLPDDVEFAELVYQLYFRHNIEEGLRDIAAGRTVSQEDVEREMREWRRSAGRTGR
jgi:predicted transcriptional regulator